MYNMYPFMFEHAVHHTNIDITIGVIIIFCGMLTVSGLLWSLSEVGLAQQSKIL